MTPSSRDATNPNAVSPGRRPGRRWGRRFTLGLAGTVLVTLSLVWARAHAVDRPAPPAGDAGAKPPAATAANTDGGTAPAKQPSANVRVIFKTVPPTRATVMWGKKRLGKIAPKAPLIIYRPRDSGPLDVVVRAEGCLPVHTRAYTFSDSVVAVKVTLEENKNTIYGYKEELPPEEDGGVPPEGETESTGGNGGAAGNE